MLADFSYCLNGRSISLGVQLAETKKNWNEFQIVKLNFIQASLFFEVCEIFQICAVVMVIFITAANI